ncbi:hypothetical protein CALVIDRAFT_532095 [Calocera viscosa TUFC12733]|uniref:Protein kinase domain-containing protein n=1 Tax=Calocera viscosa (strain TUFC12733) TaxID=1330018 RepID=A0A167FF62_CALVF|nr:hypothetical protein CALVIDRAFT_532095 [Calocera viscosa TUFC12733]
MSGRFATLVPWRGYSKAAVHSPSSPFKKSKNPNKTQEAAVTQYDEVTQSLQVVDMKTVWASDTSWPGCRTLELGECISASPDSIVYRATWNGERVIAKQAIDAYQEALLRDEFANYEIAKAQWGQCVVQPLAFFTLGLDMAILLETDGGTPLATLYDARSGLNLSHLCLALIFLDSGCTLPEVFETMTEFHKTGLFHNDIQGSNFVRSPIDGRVRVIGLAYAQLHKDTCLGPGKCPELRRLDPSRPLHSDSPPAQEWEAELHPC